MGSGLEHLLAEGVISEVIARLKSGKEADVYVVRYGGNVVAAKVYKDRAMRSFKNNSAYKEGRTVRNSRSARAIEKKSSFGKSAAEDAWKSAEADALYKLHAAEVRVPTPVMYLDGVLLMELVLDAEGDAAPRLIDTDLDAGQANQAYRDMLTQLVKILCCDLIHGDLSPYNVLWGAGGPTIIDFPQIISASHNSSSEAFFLRDARNILGYFAGIDRSLNARSGDPGEIWRAYVRRELTPEFVPQGRPRAVESRPQRVFEPRGVRPSGERLPGGPHQARPAQSQPRPVGESRPQLQESRPQLQDRPGEGRPQQGQPQQGRPQGRPQQGRPQQGRPQQGRPQQPGRPPSPSESRPQLQDRPPPRDGQLNQGRHQQDRRPQQARPPQDRQQDRQQPRPQHDQPARHDGTQGRPQEPQDRRPPQSPRAHPGPRGAQPQQASHSPHDGQAQPPHRRPEAPNGSYDGARSNRPNPGQGAAKDRRPAQGTRRQTHTPEVIVLPNRSAPPASPRLVAAPAGGSAPQATEEHTFVFRDEASTAGPRRRRRKHR